MIDGVMLESKIVHPPNFTNIYYSLKKWNEVKIKASVRHNLEQFH